MTKLMKKKSGFTLIELMIVVAIIGILAALAIPAFITYVRRSKAGEATTNLNAIFKAVSTYYIGDRITARGLTGTSRSNCITASQSISPANPGADKQASGISLPGYAISDFVYFGYAILSSSAAAGTCNTQANTDVYTISGSGDLDADNINSTFELAVRSTTNGLYKSAGFYISDETE